MPDAAIGAAVILAVPDELDVGRIDPLGIVTTKSCLGGLWRRMVS